MSGGATPGEQMIAEQLPTDIDLRLLGFGLNWVNWDSYPADFTFTFGQNQCNMPPLAAEILSPKVASIRRGRPDVLTFPFPDGELYNLFCRLVVSFYTDTMLRVERNDLRDLLKIARVLQNDGIINFLYDLIPRNGLDPAIALSFLQEARQGQVPSARNGELVDYIASLFYKLGQETLRTIDFACADAILSSPKLRIRDEDWLYNFVDSLARRDIQCLRLFRHVDFQYQTPESIAKLKQWTDDEAHPGWSEYVPASVLAQALKATGSAQKMLDPKVAVDSFCYDPAKPLVGMVAIYTQKLGGNLHDKGFVKMTGSSLFNNAVAPKFVFDLSTESLFHTARGDPSPWLCIEFVNRLFHLTGYTIRTRTDWATGHPSNWVVEGSKDGASWIVLDQRVGNGDLAGQGRVHHFPVNPLPQRFKFLRLRHTGPTHGEQNFVILSALELFGEITLV